MGRRVWVAVLMVLTVAAPAHAVVPGLVGPMQALLQLGLQFGTLIVGSMAGTLRRPALKVWLSSHRRWVLAATGTLAACVAVLLTIRHLPGISIRGTGTVDSQARWSTFQGGMTRLGSADGRALHTRPHVRWISSGHSAETLESSPALVDGRLYIGSSTLQAFEIGGAITCLDPRTGQVLWRTATEWPVFSSPVVAAGRVYCGEGLHENSNARLYCLDAGTGATLWTIATTSHTEGTATLVDDRIVFTAGEDGLYCADNRTGKVLWHATGMHADTSPAIAGGRVFVGTGYGRTRTLCLDLDTGRTLWERDCDLAAWAPPAVVGSRVWFGLGNGDFETSNPHPHGRVVCASTEDGHELWRQELPDAVLTALAVDGDRLLCGSRDGRVYAFSASQGDPLWSAAGGIPVDSSLAVAGGHVYVAGGDGDVRSLDEATGTLEWDISAVSRGPLESSLLLAGGRLYVGAGNRLAILEP